MSRVYAPAVDFKYNGHLGALHENWTGFRLVNGCLWTPDGERFEPGHLYSYVITHQRVTAQEREIQRLCAELAQRRPS